MSEDTQADGRRERATLLLARIREQMHGVTGVDEELNDLRNGSRG
ncbi:hypothetical protein [Nonomuraea longicatena]|uniref:Uncharacterized protein n=1 Tax=Nonomuraea longicatena TaxID=83682 RepID=A0ABP4BFV7_9ACTN